MDAPITTIPLKYKTLEEKQLTELLTECARDGHFLTVKALIEEAKADVNDYNSLGLTAFQLASWNKHSNIVDLLIEKGAKNTSTDFILDDSVARPLSFQLDPSLEQNRKKLEQYKYLEALIEYTRQGCLGLVTGLIEEIGVDINGANVFGLTPLKQAARNDRLAMVDLLIRKGVQVNAASFCGETALMLIYSAPHLKDISYRLLNAMTEQERFTFAAGSEDRAKFFKEFERDVLITPEATPSLIFSNQLFLGDLPFPTPTPAPTPEPTPIPNRATQHRFGNRSS